MTLQPGETYTVQVTVTNRSQYAGEPVAADLTIAIEAALNGIALIDPSSFSDWYEPGEAKTHVWEFTVPYDIGPSSGAITVEVRDPNGRRIAQASASIQVEAAETDNPTITDIFVAGSSDPSDPGNGIFVVLGNVVPEGRQLYVRAEVHSESGYYASGRDANFFSGEPVYTFNTLRPDTGIPRDYPYSHITCEIREYRGGPVLATKTIEGPFYYYQE